MSTVTTAQELVRSLLVSTTPIEVHLGSLNKDVTITKFKVKHLPIVLNVFNIVKNDILEARKTMELEFNELKEKEDEEALLKFAAGEGSSVDGLLFNLVTKHLPTLSELISVCSGIHIDEVDELDIDEASAIVMGVVLLNKDFFMERVLPMFLTSMESVESLRGKLQRNT